MSIDTDLLIAWGGVAKKFRKGEYIFHEGGDARFYYQIIEGSVKVFNTNYEGRELTQAEFISGNSFGEPALFIEEHYPSSAVTTCDSVIIKLSKEVFLQILAENPSMQKNIITRFAQQIYNKTVSSRDIINTSPALRIFSFLTAYKKKVLKEGEIIEIPYTRQQIANFTGLRVETVIRALAKMKTMNVVYIIKRKLRF